MKVASDGAIVNTRSLPDYEPMLADYHRAFAKELRAMVGSLPIREGDRVLDLACGDGAYSHWLVERVGATGAVMAVDLLPAYLNVARDETNDERAGFAAADIDRLPFPDDSFDLVWCAQSLFSLPSPVDAVRKMGRAARPGGVVAVLENDTLHQILLPWPIEVELAVRGAELLGFVEDSERPRKFYVGRQLLEVFRAAGLERCRKRTWASNRQAPLNTEERGFLEKYLRDLAERAGPHLDPKLRPAFERLVDPGSEDYMLDDPDFSLTCLDHVVLGFKPGPPIG